MRHSLPALLLALTAVAPAFAGGPQSFSLVVLPDTQFYSETTARFPNFTAQTNWIVARLAARRIAFVSHIGDIVQNGGVTTEWTRAVSALNILETAGNPAQPALVPYSVVPGNHDYATTSVKTSGTALYAANFGAARYAGEPWYLGASTNNRNHAQRFTAGGRTFLHLGLDWQPVAADFAWAQSIYNANPGLPVIISTHEHIQDPDTSGNGAGRSTPGQSTWTSFIRANSRVFMIVNGHFHRGPDGADGEHYLVSLNDAGLPVFEMLGDFQDYANGGDAWLRTIAFDPRHNTISIQTFSPALGRYWQDHNSEFQFPLDFTQRFGPASGPAQLFSPGVTTLQDGLSGYAGTLDTELRQGNAATPQGTNTTISVDGDEPAGSGNDTQALIRFTNLFGPGPLQVAADSDILDAKLRINVSNPGSGFNLHRMTADWDESSTWNALVSGVQAAGTEALAYPDRAYGRNDSNSNVPNGWVEADVTAALRAWFNGQPNLGWAMLPWAAGSNGVDFASSENAAVANRPQLVISEPDQPVSIKRFRQGVDGYTGAIDIELRQADPALSSPAQPTITVDFDEPNGSPNESTHALIRFDGLFGPGASQVPAAAAVTSAVLTLNVADPGNGFTLHRMLTDWSATDTWNSLTAGVSANDVEATIYAEAAAGSSSGGNGGAQVAVGVLYLDVTASVREWIDAGGNFGWVLRPFNDGNNGVDFHTSEAADPNLRPQLTIRYIAPTVIPCPLDLSGNGIVDADDIFAFLALWFDAPPGVPCITPPTGCPGDWNNDGTITADDIFAYLADWFAFGPGIACP